MDNTQRILLSLLIGITACTGESSDVDVDQDGVLADVDCDDFNNTLGDMSEDADCDGTLTADDCDDSDPESTLIAADGDCDGTLTADDCDDSDAESPVRAEDGDCDGTLTADDCDDSDADLNLADADGDGLSSCDGDCNDADSSVSPDATEDLLWTDSNCDGTISTYATYTKRALRSESSRVGKPVAAPVHSKCE